MPSTASAITLPILAGVLLFTTWACSGGSSGSTSSGTSSSTSGTPSGGSSGGSTATLQPANATVTEGQTLQYQVTPAPATGTATWVVQPASGGTLTAAGLFTATGTPGAYTIVCEGTGGSTLATTQVTIQAAAAPAVVTPNALAAPGGQATSASGLNLSSVLGESFPAVMSEDASGLYQIRSDFDPVPQTQN